MSGRIGLRDEVTGELRVFSAAQFAAIYDVPPDGYALVDVPDDWPAALEWDAAAEAFLPIPLRLTWRQVYALFTPDEKAAIHGSMYPPVQGLISALMATEGPIEIEGTFHQQGVALLAGLSLLTPERAARIAAGLQPEG